MGRDPSTDLQNGLSRARKNRKAQMKAGGFTPHPQPVLVHAGPPKKLGIIDKLKLANQARKVLSQAKSTNYTMNSKGLKTSIFGTGGLLVLWANVAAMLLDNDPTTSPDWSIVITATISAAGLLFAKDFNATGVAK